MTLISDTLAIPVIYILLDLMKQTPYANSLNTSWWVYVAAISASLVISLASVLWQTLRAARTNPAEALKKE
jgi:putative ABC transport system permease protein